MVGGSSVDEAEETQKPLFTSLRAPFQISLPCNCRARRRLQRRLFFRDAILRPAIAACRGRQGAMRRPARFETGRLGRGEQVTIAERIPTAIFGFRDRVTDKRACDALRRHMVKENEHRGRSQPSLERRGCGRQTQVPR